LKEKNFFLLVEEEKLREWEVGRGKKGNVKERGKIRMDEKNVSSSLFFSPPLQILVL